MKWFCYILRNTHEKYKNITYNGSTNNPIRRLRQHNEEIVGGAKATKGKEQSWEIYVLLTGFDNKINTLSCEWRIKHPTNKKLRPKKYCGVKGRVISLNEILQLENWTSKCDINNKNCSYILYIANDMYCYLDKSIIPENIQVIGVESINNTFLELIK